MLFTLFCVDTSQSTFIEQKKKAIVCISTRASLSGHAPHGYWGGSGFILDKKQGLVVTNHHVSGGHSITSIEVIFSNGRKVNAKHVWSHPFADISILKMNPEELKGLDFEEIATSQKEPHLNDQVEIYSNNSGYNFSVHRGQITSLNESLGVFPVQTLRLSVNASFGTSGAAVLNQHGEVIAIVFAKDSSGTSLFAVPIDYLKSMANKGIGAANFELSHISIDYAIKNYGYPANAANDYIQKYPESYNKMLIVSSVYENAKSFVQPGDIILAVDDEEVGPSLALYHDALNKALKKNSRSVKLTVFRNGKKTDVMVQVRPAFQHTRYLKFGGAVFMESDEILLTTLGIPLGTPLMVKVEPGSLFHVFPSILGTSQYAIGLQLLNKQAIRTFDDLEKEIRRIIRDKQRYITAVYKNFGGYGGYNGMPIISKSDNIAHLEIQQAGDAIMYKYTMYCTPLGDEWKVETVQ
ncbi:MAG: serine protease [Alphaproteobacteria bacterium]|nr:MAG: serine protease [Alphaproteobacteria bacterium]